MAPRVGERKLWFPTPSFCFVLFYLLYTSAIPVSVMFLDFPPDPIVAEFLQWNLVAGAGIFFGIVAFVAVYGRAWVNRPPAIQAEVLAKLRLDKVRFSIVLPLMLAIFIYLRFSMLGFDIRNIFSIYGMEADIVGDYTTFHTLSAQFGIAAALFSFGVYQFIATSRLRSRRLWFWTSVAIAMFFFLRGNRNHGVTALLPLFSLILARRPIRLSTGIVVVVVAYILLQFIAFSRNFGIDRLSDMEGLIAGETFAPAESELVTSFNVYNRYHDISNAFEQAWGATYTIDAVINLVPRAIWPERPFSYSERFVRIYLGTAEVSEGFGFSPLVEAIINFDYGGLVFVFFIWGFFVCYLDQRFRQARSLTGVLAWATLVPLVVNWNRIDFSTTLKLYLIYVCLFWLYERIVIRRRQAGDTGSAPGV